MSWILTPESRIQRLNDSYPVTHAKSSTGIRLFRLLLYLVPVITTFDSSKKNLVLVKLKFYDIPWIHRYLYAKINLTGTGF